MAKVDLTRPNSTYMAIIFDSEIQFHQKLHFRTALIIIFQMIYNLFGFEEVKISPLFLVMTSFVTLEVRFLKISFCILVGLNCAKFHWAQLEWFVRA